MKLLPYIINRLNTIDDNNKQGLNEPFIIEKKFIYLAYLENVKKVIKSLLLLIDLFQFNKTNFYEELVKEKIMIENNDNICLRDTVSPNNFIMYKGNK